MCEYKMFCPICCDESSSFIGCFACGQECCLDCFTTYIFTCDLTPKCMFCSIEIPLHEIISRTDKRWYKKYRVYRRKCVWKHNQPMIRKFTEERNHAKYFGDNSEYKNGTVFRCTSKSCNAGIVRTLNTETEAMCTSCLSPYCVDCRQVRVGGHSCDPGMVQTVKDC